MKYFWNDAERIESGLLSSQKITLFLDFDGTLSPFKPTPLQAKLPKKTKVILEKLSLLEKLHLTIVSGRGIEDLKKKVNIKGVSYSGNHGLEYENNRYRFKKKVPAKILLALQTIENEMKNISKEYKGSLVENKTYSIALYYRGINPAKKRELENILQRKFNSFISKNEVSFILDKDTYEIRADIGWTKGNIVSNFEKISRKEIGKAIYIGDSETDEDAFKKLTNDITIRVGFAERSRAKYFLKNEKDVQSFLDWLLILNYKKQ